MLLGCIMCWFAACAPRYPERPLPNAGQTGTEGDCLGDSPYSLYYKFTTSENEVFADRFIKLE